ncbi:MAG: S-layer homology domain-containing protein [Eubacterium sp.]|nr:S-layer homology domain-containing protein [Eubacterium sp.]
MKKLAIFLTFLIILMISFNSYAAEDENPFTDVQEGSNYYKEVLWAVNTDPQIVQGITKDKFKPFTTCNRAQMVTFLWRMKGCPEPETTKNPFKDVKTTDFFYKPVLWASENSITSGKAKDKFAPLDSCTRAQFVTFLWRMEDEPEVRCDENPFVDVSSDAMYTPAVLWASRYKITSGKDSTHFAPNNIINRAQTVMFLYRLNQYEQGEFDDATRDVYIADNVANLVRVIYAPGDYEDSVINDLTLNTEFEGVNVSWSSSDTTIVSNNGKVTRPDGANKTVTLTATVKVNQAVAKRTFTVKVIRNKNIDVNALQSYTVEDIRNINKDKKNFFIEYNNSVMETSVDEEGIYSVDCPLSAINGKFSDIIIESSEDAIVALYGINEILKLDDPKSELEIACVNYSEYGTHYTFNQIFYGIEVYGRHLTLSADNYGNVTSVTSSCYSIDKYYSIKSETQISVEDALSIVYQSCPNNEYNVFLYKTVIYNLDEFEDNPIFAYIISAEPFDDYGETPYTFIINSIDGTIIFEGNNQHSITGKGHDEIGKLLDDPILAQPGRVFEFPVEYDWSGPFTKTYYMKDSTRNIQVYIEKKTNEYCDKNNTWDDPTAISAYNNVIKTFDWYNKTLNRFSIDGNGAKIPVVIHAIDYYRDKNDNYKKKRMYDNAYWNGKSISYFDNTDKSLPTTANGFDIAAHEYTHAVASYITNDGFDHSHTNGHIVYAIDEAYADIFGCFAEGDFKIAEDWLSLNNMNCLRDIETPENCDCPSKYEGTYWCYDTDDIETYAHTNSTVISHAAYLMSKGLAGYGCPSISKDKLILLWYHSLENNYDSTSDYWTVRRNVLLSADYLGFSDSEIATINKAFDIVGISSDRYYSTYDDYIKNVLISTYGIYDPTKTTFVFPPNVVENQYSYSGNGGIICTRSISYSYLYGYDESKRDHYREINADLSGIYYTEIGDFNYDSISDLLVIRSESKIPMADDEILQKYYVIVELYQKYCNVILPIRRIMLQADNISISDFTGYNGNPERCLTIVNNDRPEKYVTYNSAYVDTSIKESNEEIFVISLNNFKCTKSCHYNGKTGEPTYVTITENGNSTEKTLLDDGYFLFMDGKNKTDYGLLGKNEEILFRFYGGIANSFQREYLFDQ